MAGIRLHGGKLPADFPLHLLFKEPQDRDADQLAAAQSDLALGVAVNRAVEAFHFLAFAIAAVLVFPSLFFPFASRPEGTLYALLVLALSWLAKPLGHETFMAIQRRAGIVTRMVTAFILLGVSTAGVAFLPGYKSLGFAAIALLALLRIGQGIAFGGLREGRPLHRMGEIPLPRRGWHAWMGQLAGFTLAAGLFTCLSDSLSTEEFQDWGWRYPFFIALAIDGVALFARLRLDASDAKGRLLNDHRL